MTRIMNMTSYGVLNALLAIWFFMKPQHALIAVVHSSLATAGIAAVLWFMWYLVLGDRTEFFAIQEDINKWRLGRKDKCGFTIDNGTFPDEKAVLIAIKLHRKGLPR